MSWRDAPLYVEAQDLAVWVTGRAAGFQGAIGALMAPRVSAPAELLLEQVCLALTFPATRADHLRQADEAVVRLRAMLRLAREHALVSPGGLRYAAGRLIIIGRMIGGWRKRVERSSAGQSLPSHHLSGGGPPPATGA